MKTVKRVLNILGVAAGLILLVAVVAVLVSPQAVAQLRAALVKDVDEPDAPRTTQRSWAPETAL